MKRIGIYLLLLLGFTGFVNGQDTLLFDGFESTTAFSLNTSDEGSNPNGFNDWVINNTYNGGSGSLVCMGFPFTFNVANTDAQPAGISNPNGNYMHILGDDAAANNIFCSNYRPADGFCTFAETNFSGMSADVSTLGYDTVALSFWWLCGGSVSAFGEVYYSTNSGTSWTQVLTPVTQYANQTTWTTTTLQDAAFANQATLRFGFRFNNQQATAGADPGFGLDDVLITGLAGCAATVDSQMVAICPGDSVFAGGSFQTAAGVYVDTLVNAQGCDSLFVTDLSLLPSYSVSDTTSICQGDSIFLSGAFQTASGIYTDNFQTALGCDSTVVTALSVDPAFLINVQDTICHGDSLFAGGAFQTMAGLYTDNLSSAQGCDSTVQTQLTVIQVDTAVTETGNVLSSNAQNATFSWLECITGNPTGVSTSTFTPTSSGQYYVVVTQNGCSASSGCHTVVVVSTEESLGENIQVYPVPTENMLKVDFQGKLLSGTWSVINLQGKSLMSQSFEASPELQLQLEQLPAGAYFLELKSEGGSHVTKILKN